MKDYILELDKPRELRYGFKALGMIETKFGNKSIEQIIATIKMGEVPPLVHAGLKWDESGLTVERVADLLDDKIPKKYNMMEIVNIALTALAEHLGVDVKKALADAAKKKAEEARKAEIPEKKEVKKTIPSSKKRKK